MKMKCFSKRKLNVRISKTKIKCVNLGFSQNRCILGKSRKNWSFFWSNLAKIQQFWENPKTAHLIFVLEMRTINFHFEKHLIFIFTNI